MKGYLIALLSVFMIFAACASYYQAQTVPAQGVQPPPGQQAQSSAPAVTYVNTAQTSLGTILVDDNGKTLYVKAVDSGACTGTCAQNWPYLAASSVASRVSLPGTLSTITRADGTTQAAYNNQPLYNYIGDTASGQTNGNGVANIWSVVVITPPAQQTQSSGFGY